jgi:asparagine synthase (glutamine-hydrolysing)
MVEADADLSLVYNGEVYNFQELRTELQRAGHVFRSTGDAEVILKAYQAWGPALLERLNGMFAFALYDARKRVVFMARDRAGEKPLYYSQRPDALLFASELKSLLSVPGFVPVLDLQSLHYYLAFGFVPGELCILQNVRKLPPAHALLYHLDTQQLHTWRYWQLPEYEPVQRTTDQHLAVLEDLLRDSVRLRLLADVPVGISLSGGVDSSLITALAAALSPEPPRTFTVTFPGSATHDERAHAALVARHFRTNHAEIEAEPLTVGALPELARQFDEPIADSSMLPTYLLARAIREQATVALFGDGGDELFGGYPHYLWAQRAAGVQAGLPRFVRTGLSAMARRLPLGTRGRHYLLGLQEGAAETVAHINLYFDRFTRRELAPARAGSDPCVAAERFKMNLCRPQDSVLRQAMRVDFLTYLPDALLVKVDRASMLASLEVRTPFLDHRVVEFAFRELPDSLRATRNERKVLLRRLAARLLPAQLDLTRKQGFSIPIDDWLRGPWRRPFADWLADSPLFHARVVQQLFSGLDRGRANGQRLFALAIFELWRREYGIRVPD